MRAARFCRRLAEALTLVLLVSLPTLVNPLGGFPFDPIKAALLHALAALIAATWLAGRLLGAPGADVGANPIVRAGLVVGAAVGVSTLLSINPLVSFFGSYYREMGWLTTASGLVLLVVGADLWSQARPRERAITAMLASVVLPGAYALVQHLGRDPLPWTSLGGPSSTLGSPTFLGGYLVLVACLALYRVALTGRDLTASTGASTWTTIRYAGYLGLLLAIAALVTMTTIRAPLLGLVVEVLVFAGLVAWRLPANLRRMALAAAGAFLIVTVALSAATGGQGGLLVLGRFLGASRPGPGQSSAFLSVSERVVVWSAALPLPLRDPLRAFVGFGPESQLPILQYAEAAARTTSTEGGQWDRAHDLFIDTWLTGGVLGLLALVVLLGTVGLVGVRAARTRASPESLLAAALVAGLAGHITEVSFAFQTVVTATDFWVLAALTAGLVAVWPEPREVARHPLGVARIAGASGALLAGLLFVPAMTTLVMADNQFGAASRLEQAGAYQAAARRAETASGLTPWIEDMPRTAGLSWEQLGVQRAGLPGEQLLARAEGELQRAIRRGPHDPFAQFRLARLYLAWARHDPVTRSRDELLQQADQTCARALSDGPYMARTWQGCAEISAERGAADEAAARTARARELTGSL